MNKLARISFICLFLIIGILLVYNVKKDTKIILKDKNVYYDLPFKGFKNARDFCYDGKNIYVAFENKIQIIEETGKSYILFKNSSMDIDSIEYYKDKLYIASKISVFSYDLKTKLITEIINNLPNFGDYSDSKLLARDDKIYISIGAATNSAVVGDDNKWLNENPYNYDITPKDITISSNKNSKLKTGAFVPYNTKNIAGQKISGHSPGNASIIYYNLLNNKTELYGWGIRNIKGMDFNNKGNIIATIGGMEPRGERSVKGDVDYIYELKEGLWYGWPDYSGGDPISSPRFKGKNNGKIPFLLDMHPSTNPPAPLYQNKSLDTLTSVAVDKEGMVGEKDSIFFYDNKDKIVYNIGNKGVLEEKIKLSSAFNIVAMKIYKDKIMMLDNKGGTLINISKQSTSGLQSVRIVIIYLLIMIILAMVIMIWKLSNQ